MRATQNCSQTIYPETRQIRQNLLIQLNQTPRHTHTTSTLGPFMRTIRCKQPDASPLSRSKKGWHCFRTTSASGNLFADTGEWGVPKITQFASRVLGPLQNMAPRKHPQCQHIQKHLHEMLARNVSRASGSIAAGT